MRTRMKAPRHAHGGPFSPSVFVRILGIELRISGSGENQAYLARAFTDRAILLDSQFRFFQFRHGLNCSLWPRNDAMSFEFASLGYESAVGAWLVGEDNVCAVLPAAFGRRCSQKEATTSCSPPLCAQPGRSD